MGGRTTFTSLQPVASTFNAESATVDAEQDRHYFIRVGGRRYIEGAGIYGDGPPQRHLGDEFTLAWMAAVAPAESVFAASGAGDRISVEDASRQPILAEEDPPTPWRNEALDAAIERIAAESSQPDAAFAVLPAPIGQDAVDTGPPAPPRPPVGYAFVPYHGEMAQVPDRRTADVAASSAPKTTMTPSAKLIAITQELRSREILPTFVTLTAGDPDGRWRRELERLGLVVGRFDSVVRAYAANIPAHLLDAVAEANFVQAIEPVQALEALSNTAAPSAGADGLRTLVTPGLFAGATGAGTPVGILDTGLNISHPDIHSGRSSICGASFSDHVQARGLWVGHPQHGTHVAGILAGNGRLNPSLAGVAPGVRHLRIVNIRWSTASPAPRHGLPRRRHWLQRQRDRSRQTVGGQPQLGRHGLGLECANHSGAQAGCHGLGASPALRRPDDESLPMEHRDARSAGLQQSRRRQELARGGGGGRRRGNRSLQRPWPHRRRSVDAAAGGPWGVRHRPCRGRPPRWLSLLERQQHGDAGGIRRGCAAAGRRAGVPAAAGP